MVVVVVVNFRWVWFQVFVLVFDDDQVVFVLVGFAAVVTVFVFEALLL